MNNDNILNALTRIFNAIHNDDPKDEILAYINGVYTILGGEFEEEEHDESEIQTSEEKEEIKFEEIVV